MEVTVHSVDLSAQTAVISCEVDGKQQTVTAPVSGAESFKAFLAQYAVAYEEGLSETALTANPVVDHSIMELVGKTLDVSEYIPPPPKPELETETVVAPPEDPAPVEITRENNPDGLTIDEILQKETAELTEGPE